MKKTVQRIYVILVLVFLLAPSAGRLFTGQEAAENEIESKLPSLKTEEGRLNTDLLSELGGYFEQHFAQRSRFISANAKIMQNVFQESSDDGVIVGTDGWLYYADSLEDYLGTRPMSGRQILNLARSLAILERTLAERGVDFLYVPVPNKNTLYEEHMPYYDQIKVTPEHNLFRLYEALEKEGVSYLNLYETFSADPDILYHKTDSHWTNQGAALAGSQILQALGKESPDYTQESYSVRKDFTGDLEKMLYPENPETEEEIYYDRGHSFEYVTEIESNYDPYILTTNVTGTGSAVIYRDSFGNALLPFLADGYGQAFFSRGGVYSVTDVENYQADTMIIERVERLLWNSLPYPYILPAAMVILPEDREPSDRFVIEESRGNSTEAAWPSLVQNGQYLQLKGFLPEAPDNTECYLYVRLQDGCVYEALPCSYQADGEWQEYGYCVNLYAGEYQGEPLQVEVFATDAPLEQIAFQTQEFWADGEMAG